MRVTGGDLARRTLHAPPGERTRPTADKVRQALFNILQADQGAIAGDVLDLYAGSGALGIEALSRGAARAVFVDQDAAARRALSRNLSDLGLDARARVLPGDALRAVAGLPMGTAFDLILADPPYRDAAEVLPALLTLVAERGLLRPAGTLVVEFALHPRDPLPVPERVAGPGQALSQSGLRRYGQTGLAFYVVTGPGSTVDTEDHRSRQPS